MRKSGVRPVTLLYALVAVCCIIGPVSYGFLWDVSMITKLTYRYLETAPTRIPSMSSNMCCFSEYIHCMVILLTTAMISLVQLLVLNAYKITSNMVLVAFLSEVVFAIAVSSIIILTANTEISGAHSARRME